MQTKTEEFTAQIKTQETPKAQPRVFALYEEYSQKPIAETIKTRRDVYEKADTPTRREIETEVEIEVENFHIWLELKKNFEPFAAHYYSVSLKSLLLGLSVGLQIAQFFDSVLEKFEILPS